MTHFRNSANLILVALGVVLAAPPGASAHSSNSPAQVASAPIRVGDGTVRGDRLHPYSNAWIMKVRRADGQSNDLGVWTDLLRLREVGGRKIYVRVQGMSYANGKASATVNTFDPVSLAPISSINATPDGRVITRKFNGVHIDTTVIAAPGAALAHSSLDTPEPAFDFNGGMYGVLLAAMPLKTGYAGTLPAVAEFEDQLAPVSFRVTGRETVAAGARGARDCWVVEVLSGPAAGYVFWISQAEPYVIRLQARGPANGEIIWEMIS